METKNNNQVPQEQAVHLIQSALHIFRDEIFRLQAELEKLKQPEFKVLSGGYTYKDGFVRTPTNHYIPQPGEVVEVSDNGNEWFVRIFVEYDLNNDFKCVENALNSPNVSKYRKGEKHLTNNWNYCRCLNGEIIEFGCDEPNPYAVDWSNAPEWADVHIFKKNKEGQWKGCTIHLYVGWVSTNMDSGFTLPSGLDWKESKTVRPK